MSTPIQFSEDPERNRRLWNQYLADIDAEIREEQAGSARFVPVAKALEDIVIKPGSQHAQAAYEAGREDEYSNRMKARYGGEW